MPQWWLRLYQFHNFSPELCITNFAFFNLSRQQSKVLNYLLKNGERYARTYQDHIMKQFICTLVHSTYVCIVHVHTVTVYMLVAAYCYQGLDSKNSKPLSDLNSSYVFHVQKSITHVRKTSHNSLKLISSKTHDPFPSLHYC